LVVIQGFFIGNWSLNGTNLHITNLFDASGQYALPEGFSTPRSPTLPATNITHGSHGHGHGHGHSHSASGASGAVPASTTPKYTFQMTLQLRSRPLGRWNRLEIVEYGSVNTDGEFGLLPLKHERPFWFSKVKSWA
jgi:F-box protein 9